MAESTGIEWCDATFNPWWGCEKVSPGCAHCYADTLATRYGYGDTWGAGHALRLFDDRHWNQPLRWAARLPAKLDRRPRVFCASMADVFEERDDLDYHRVRLFKLIEETPELDWLILTKRPDFARDWLQANDPWTYPTLSNGWKTKSRDGLGWHLPSNIWLGTSIENARYTWRADALREIPAAVRFISAEPLLGSLYEGVPLPEQEWTTAKVGHDQYTKWLDLTGIDWLIVGGESAPRARPMHPGWARELRDTCLRTPLLGAAVVIDGVPQPGRDRPAFLFKQWGEWAPLIGDRFPVGARTYVHTGRGDPEQFYGPLHGASMCPGEPAVTAAGDPIIVKAGKGRAGRELDGRVWHEFPRGVS